LGVDTALKEAVDEVAAEARTRISNSKTSWGSASRLEPALAMHARARARQIECVKMEEWRVVSAPQHLDTGALQEKDVGCYAAQWQALELRLRSDHRFHFTCYLDSSRYTCM
jgi:hypothetical protein